MHILIGFTKDFAEKAKEIEYIRILGFNNIGQKYLNTVKKDVTLKILSKFEKNYSKILDFELKTTEIYDLIKNDNLVYEEYTNHLGKKE